MNSKAVSRLLKVPVSTLQYYESVGLLTPLRSDNNYRVYSEEDLSRVKLILFMKKMNFSLEEMKMSLSHYYYDSTSFSSETSLAEKSHYYEQKKVTFQKRIEEYQRSIAIMDKVITLMKGEAQIVKKEKLIHEIDELVNQFWKEDVNDV